VPVALGAALVAAAPPPGRSRRPRVAGPRSPGWVAARTARGTKDPAQRRSSPPRRKRPACR